jgi:hypothetical protein
MSDLRRWSEEGASPEETALIQASKRERSSEASHRRMLAAVGLGITSTGAAATATGGSATASAATGAAASGAAGVAAGASIVAKLGVGTLLMALVGGGAFWATRAPRPAIVAAKVPPAPSAHTPLPGAAPPSAGTVDSAEESLETDAPPETTKHAKPAPKSQLSEEVSALEVAQRALAHDGRAALRALDRYHAQFPRGSLAAEETVLRVRALLRLGEAEQAATLADAFSARYPDSPYARRMQALVHGQP